MQPEFVFVKHLKEYFFQSLISSHSCLLPQSGLSVLSGPTPVFESLSGCVSAHSRTSLFSFFFACLAEVQHTLQLVYILRRYYNTETLPALIYFNWQFHFAIYILNQSTLGQGVIYPGLCMIIQLIVHIRAFWISQISENVCFLKLSLS